MDSKNIIKMLNKDGWKLVSIRGSHHKFEKGGKIVIVPHPKKDMPLGTYKSILKMAGLKK